MKYSLVVFDSDGTLADTLPWARGIFNELAEEHGFRKVAESEYEELRDLHGRALLKALEVPLWKVPRIVHDVRVRMAARIGSFRLFPGIAEAIEGLAEAGVQIGIVSSNSKENVQAILGERLVRLVNHFDCSASMFGKTPKIRRVVRRSGVKPPAAIYVGDEIRDAESARKAGIAYGAVAWGQQSLGALLTQKPEVAFHEPGDLVRKLR